MNNDVVNEIKMKKEIEELKIIGEEKRTTEILQHNVRNLSYSDVKNIRTYIIDDYNRNYITVLMKKK